MATFSIYPENSMVGSLQRTGLFVTARVHASRLPRKMLCELGGQPALGFLLRRMRAARAPGLRVLCTTEHADDQVLAQIAQALGWQVFGGDSRDVLKRYADACSRFDIDFFVNVDGDDLFCCPRYVDLILDRFRENPADYIYCEGLPFGTAPIGVRAEALRDVCTRKVEEDTQGWGKYFTGSGLYRVERIEAPPALNRPDFRLTLDYPEDLTLFRMLLAAADPEPPWDWELTDLVPFLDEHPEIAGLNQRVAASYWKRFQKAHGAFDHRAFIKNKRG